MSWLNPDARPSKLQVLICCVVAVAFVVIVMYSNSYWRMYLP